MVTTVQGLHAGQYAQLQPSSFPDFGGTFGAGLEPWSWGRQVLAILNHLFCFQVRHLLLLLFQHRNLRWRLRLTAAPTLSSTVPRLPLSCCSETCSGTSWGWWFGAFLKAPASFSFWAGCLFHCIFSLFFSLSSDCGYSWVDLFTFSGYTLRASCRSKNYDVGQVIVAKTNLRAWPICLSVVQSEVYCSLKKKKKWSILFFSQLILSQRNRVRCLVA